MTAGGKLILLTVCVSVLTGSAGIFVYEFRRNGLDVQLHEEREKVREAQERLHAEEARTTELRNVVHRLTTERRVADVVVTDQRESAGVLRTTLLFVEYARDGSPLPAKYFTVEGKQAHIDAMVIKFDGKFVEENDALRGHSLALFTSIYGDKQSPATAERIDEPGTIPPIYRGTDPRSEPFEKDLWTNFWKLADDAAYRTRMGVRVAQGEGVWRPFERGWLYTLSLESNGGLNIVSEPLKGIFKELQNQPAATQLSPPL